MQRELYQDGGISSASLLADKLNISIAEAQRIIDTMELPVTMEDPQDIEVMENLQLKQMLPQYQYNEQNPYTGPRDMRMYGGVPRQQYGLGSFVSSIAGGIGDALGGIGDAVGDVLNKENLDKIAQVASFIPGPHQPFAQAYTAGSGSGLFGNDYGGFQIGGFTPSGGSFGGFGGGSSGGTFGGFGSGDSLFSSFMPGGPTGGMNQGLGSFNIGGLDINVNDALKLASSMTQQDKEFQRTGDYDVYTTGGGIGGGRTTDEGGIDWSKILGSVGDIIRGAGDFAKQNEGLIRTGAAGAGAKLAYDDQKRINELIQAQYEDYMDRKAAKRKQYYGESPLTGLDVRNRTRTKSDIIGRRGAAAGGIIKGLRGASKLIGKAKDDLDEAYEMVTSRSDFDFKDYKMRGQQMAEELAEIRFKKDFDDLDQRTQLDLYSEASDYLNDVAADAADNAYDMMKERFGKADGGILNVRTNPEGVQELDMRAKGGYIPPIGIKEKADDIPAMLSNNEFVFTADAVRNAGGGDVNKGAQKMYALMEELENGGRV